MKILSFGEVLWDVYPDKRFIGGAPMNFAAHLAKHGEEVYMLSAVGQDELGEAALAQLAAWGISTEYVAVLPDKQTGCCLVTLDERQVPSYNLLEGVAYDAIPGEVTGKFDVLYFGTLALRSAYNKASLEKLLAAGDFSEVFVDVNIRPPFYSAETVRFAVEHATILKVSDEELATVAELLGMAQPADHTAFAKQLAATYGNLRCVIITLGGEGAYALDCGDGAAYTCASVPVTVASTVGAGDSFSAAFLHQYLQGNDRQTCLQYAARVAGFVVSEYGAVPDYKVEDFM